MIQLTENHKEWAKLYKAEAKTLKGALGKSCISLFHIGATACAGIPALPVIDILAVLKDTSAAEALTSCGYLLQANGTYTAERQGQAYRVICILSEDKQSMALHMAYLNYFLGQKQHALEFGQKKQAIAEQYADDRQGSEDAKKTLYEELAPIALEHKAKTEKQSSYMAIGMCLGMSIGTAIGAALGNISIGMCMGISVGMCLGLALGASTTSKKSDK